MGNNLLFPVLRVNPTPNHPKCMLLKQRIGQLPSVFLSQSAISGRGLCCTAQRCVACGQAKPERKQRGLFRFAMKPWAQPVRWRNPLRPYIVLRPFLCYTPGLQAVRPHETAPSAAAGHRFGGFGFQPSEPRPSSSVNSLLRYSISPSLFILDSSADMALRSTPR